MTQQVLCRPTNRQGRRRCYSPSPASHIQVCLCVCGLGLMRGKSENERLKDRIVNIVEIPSLYPFAFENLTPSAVKTRNIP